MADPHRQAAHMTRSVETVKGGGRWGRRAGGGSAFRALAPLPLLEPLKLLAQLL
jgi:hypothetical protein